MDYIYVGKIVNTHGIKGEVRILSDFNYKKDIFKKNFKIYIGNNKIEKIIFSYRVHKNYDMVTFFGINDINDVLEYKGKNVYINRDDLDGFIFDEDYIGMNVYTDHLIGKVSQIRKSVKYDYLVIEGKKEFLVPKIDPFIKEISFEDKKIILEEIEGLIDED